jgi:predicted 3-demethylubiquinone-9 3-methyltransferase (glyoxalase superfamily)
MKSLVFLVLMTVSGMSFAATDLGQLSTNLGVTPMVSKFVDTASQFDMSTYWRRCWIGQYGHRHCRWGW